MSALDRDEVRRARRAFVRSQHPDRGGDPVAFAEGLARFQQLLGGVEPTSSGGGQQVRVTVLRRPRGLAGWLRHLGGRLTGRPRRPPRVH